MLPITLLAPTKLAGLLKASAALEANVNELAAANQTTVPIIPSTQVFVSSAPVGIADLQPELAYPRVNVFAARLKNNQAERFRSVSGSVSVVAEIAATSDLLAQVDQWIHFYVEVVSTILQENRGDWGDGLFYSGAYEVEVKSPQAGGSGFLQVARVSCELGVSRN